METNNKIAPAKSNNAVMTRREMAKNPDVMSKLGPVERAVFLASTAKPICEYTGAELSADLVVALKWISKDIGYKATNQSDEQYLVIRTAEILKRYYSNFTLGDFRMAFEMSLTGELDEFLPRGRDGQPDRNHYQQFNAEYVCKILNAYKARRGWIMKKAYDSLPPAPRPEPTEGELQFYRNATKRECVMAFYHFKYRGYLPYMTPIAEMLYYNILSSVGLADEVDVTDAERLEIWERTIAEFTRKGMVADVERLRRLGVSAPEQQNRSFSLARRKALIRAFDWIVEREIQITDYVKFE